MAFSVTCALYDHAFFVKNTYQGKSESFHNFFHTLFLHLSIFLLFLWTLLFFHYPNNEIMLICIYVEHSLSGQNCTSHLLHRCCCSGMTINNSFTKLQFTTNSVLGWVSLTNSQS